MSRPKITAEDLLQDLAELVEEYGADHVDLNRSHRYIVDGKPACLVAHILVKHGVIRVPKMFNNHVINAVLQEMRLVRRFDGEAVKLLVMIQRWQDAEWTWGRVEEWAKYKVDVWRSHQ